MESAPRPARFAIIFALLAAAFPAASEGGPLYIDLAAHPLYVRVGFDSATIGAVPAPGAPGWKVLPRAGKEGRNVRPIELDLPGWPKRPPFSLKTYAPMEFTYLIPFFVGEEMRRLVVGPGDGPRGGAVSRRVPGIHFAGLGDNWEIFLNGAPIRSELHLDAAGRILRHRSLRDVSFPLDGSLFRAGANVLAIRFVADPTFPPSGFNQASPYYIDDYERIERANVELWPMILIGLYIFIGLYHLFMFGARPQDRHNLFYGLFSVDLGLYLLARTHSIALLIPDSDIVFKVELFTLFFLLPLVGAFLEVLKDNRVGKVTLAYGVFCALFAVAEVFAPKPFAHDLLRVWQVSGLIMAFYLFGYDILWRFLSDGHRRWKRQRDAEGGTPLALLYLRSLVSTPIGNLLIGGLILFLAAIFDIIDAVFFQWDLVLTQYGFFLFTMGTALILANRLGFLHDQLRGLNQNLEGRLKSLTEASVLLAASERRYRSLFDGTSEAVALLDERLAFIEGNKAAAELFGLDRPGRSGYRLTDAVYAEGRDGPVALALLEEAAKSQTDKGGARAGDGPASAGRASAARTSATREIAIRLKSPLGEARPCRLKLERIDSLERKEILLRVIPEPRDALIDAFVEGRERFEIESGLSAAEEVCRRAAAGLPRYLPEEDAGFLAICLREIVVNAVEHGSLEISFEEKSESQRAGRYFEFLQERRLDPRFRDRKVVIEYSVSASRATYRVTDSGPGFDHRALLGKGGEPDPELLEHGRGLFMTKSAFDLVHYNDRGNQVTLVKYFAGSRA
jgi:PAS domain-containing protein